MSVKLEQYDDRQNDHRARGAQNKPASAPAKCAATRPDRDTGGQARNGQIRLLRNRITGSQHRRQNDKGFCRSAACFRLAARQCRQSLPILGYLNVFILLVNAGQVSQRPPPAKPLLLLEVNSNHNRAVPEVLCSNVGRTVRVIVAGVKAKIPAQKIFHAEAEIRICVMAGKPGIGCRRIGRMSLNDNITPQLIIRAYSV